MRILIVEDSRRLSKSIREALTRAGYAVDQAFDGGEGLHLALSIDYDTVILDLMLPVLDGFALLKALRDRGKKTHVLILSARDEVDSRVQGLQEGADDYLVKPFALEELLARVAALVRRTYGTKTSRIRVGELEIDSSARIATRQGDVLDLTPREFALLEFLALKRGEVVTRTEIEEHLYDERSDPMSNVVDSFIYRLRKKIEREGGPSLIRTRRGVGYYLDDEAS